MYIVECIIMLIYFLIKYETNFKSIVSLIADDFVFLSMCRSFRTTYDVNSLPKLIVVKDTGEIITKTGRKEVQDRGFIGYRNWRQAANLKEGGKLHSSAIIKSDRTLDPKDSDA